MAVQGDGTPAEPSLERRFAENTTCHGLRNIAAAPAWSWRTFWVLGVLLACCLLLLQVTRLCQHYFSFSAVTEFNIKRDKEMEFPAVTICNFNRFSRRKLTREAARYGLDEGAYWDYLSSLFGSTALLDPEELVVAKDAFSLVDEAVRAVRGELDMIRLVEEVAQDLDDFLPPNSCMWLGNNHSFNCPDTYFSRVMTSHGPCFTFNYHGQGPERRRFYQDRSGQGWGLAFAANIEEWNYSERFNGASQIGVLLMLHATDAFPGTHSRTFALPPGTYGYLAVEPTQEIYEKPPWGVCGDAQPKFFQTYSAEHCELECLIIQLRQHCGCVSIDLQGIAGLPACTPFQVVDCLQPSIDNFVTRNSQEAGECVSKCRIECRRIKHRGSLSYAQFPNRITARQYMAKAGLNFTQDNVRFFRNNYLVVQVYFQELTLYSTQQKPGKQTEDLLADIGGQMGLFLGASLITLAEALEFLLRKCYHRFCARTGTGQDSQSKQPKINSTVQVQEITTC